MTTGLIIKLLRTADSLSQTELARRLGVTRAYLSQVENSKKQPGLPLLRDVSRVFQIPMALLVVDEGEGAEFNEMREILGSLLSARLSLGREEAQ